MVDGSSKGSLVEGYLSLGLAVGRHVEGLVDAYYGPPELAERASAGSPRPPAELAQRARELLSALADGGASGGASDLDPHRRAWIAAQVRGLETTASKLAGDKIAYLDEVERCYGARPALVDEEAFAEAHRRLEAVVPGKGPLAERYIAWREAQAVPPDKLEAAFSSLCEDFRERTGTLFGLPDGERIEFVLESGKPWSGFNYYLGGLCSRVAINVDLPVLSLHLGHLAAHEAYPGHHTEHCRKEAGLVRRRHQLEESIFLVGTPQCLLAEGLADLGLEVIVGPRPEPVLAEHLHGIGVPYDGDVAAEVAAVDEVLSKVRPNAAIGVHDRGWGPDEAISYLRRWALLPEPRAKKSIDFIIDPTWSAYVFCYSEGLRLCRGFVAGDSSRFERLITEQFLPSDLVAP